MKHKPIGEQVIVVFGATSGIGRATTLAARERGARVLAAGRDGEALVTLAADDDEIGLGACTADAAQPDNVEHVAARAVATFGRIDTWGTMLALQRISPPLVDVIARTAAFQLQRSAEPEATGADAFVDAPRGDDRVHGVVSSLHR